MTNRPDLPNEYEIVDTDERLQALFADVNAPIVAIDTEFIRTDTFFPKLGLVQLRMSGANYLLDTKATNHKACMQAAFDDADICFVFHACGEDLEVLNCEFSTFPRTIFDTQIAAAFCGLGSQLGYQTLLKALLDVDIPKGQTRSDWLRRPLSSDQLQYAALDVHYLLEIEQLLRDKLIALDRLHWVEEECATVVTHASAPPAASSQYYLSLKSPRSFRPEQLQLLKNLTQWREDKCRSDDIPRSFLLKDAAVFWVAEHQPTSKKHLAEAPNIKGKAVKDYGDEILALIATSMAQTPEALQALEPPLGKQFNCVSKAIKSVITAKSEQLNVPPEWLFRNKWLPDVLKSYSQALHADEQWQAPAQFQGWRQREVLPELEASLKKHADLIKTL